MVPKRSLPRSIAVLALALSCAFPGLLPPASADQADHPTIKILSDQDFTAFNGVVGGTGTPTDPFLIRDWRIKVPHGGVPSVRSTESADAAWSGSNETSGVVHGIHIQNTRAHFLVENVQIEGGGIGRHGVFLENAANGTIRSAEVWDSDYGIYVVNSESMQLEDNHAHRNFCDIELRTSKNVTMRGNRMSDAEHGFGIRGSEPDNYRHTIDETNVIEGRPILYRQGATDLEIDGSVPYGYVGLIDSSNVAVRGLELSHAIQGIVLANVTGATVEDVRIRHMHGSGVDVLWSRDVGVSRVDVSGAEEFGVYVVESDQVRVVESSLGGNGNGLFVRDSGNITISRNAVLANNEPGIHQHLGKGRGVQLISSHGAVVVGNTFEAQADGSVVLIGGSRDNRVENNTIRGGAGVRTFQSSGDQIRGNVMTALDGTAFHLERAHRLLVELNVVDGASEAVNLRNSQDLTLRSNTFLRVQRGFGIHVDLGFGPEHYNHDIAASNLQDGRPWIYRRDLRDESIAGDPAFVGLINPLNVTMDGLDLHHGQQGLFVFNGTRLRLENLDVHDADTALEFVQTSQVSMSGSRIWNASIGLALARGSLDGLYEGNAWFGNRQGMRIDSLSDGNRFYGNLMANEVDADDRSGTTAWSRTPSQGGNYWAGDWAARDVDGDGWSESPHTLVGSRDVVDPAPGILLPIPDTRIIIEPQEPRVNQTVQVRLEGPGVDRLEWVSWVLGDHGGPGVRTEATPSQAGTWHGSFVGATAQGTFGSTPFSIDVAEAESRSNRLDLVAQPWVWVLVGGLLVLAVYVVRRQRKA